MSKNGPVTHYADYDFEIVENDWDFVRESLAPVIGTYRYCYNKTLDICFETYETEGIIPMTSDCYEEVLWSIYVSGWGSEPRDDLSVGNAVNRARGAFYRFVELGAEMPCVFSKQCRYQHVRLRASYDAPQKALLLLDGAIALHVDGVDPRACGEGLAQITIDTGCGVEPPRGWAKLQLRLSSEEVIGRFDKLSLFDEKLPEMDAQLYEELVACRNEYRRARSGPRLDYQSMNRYARALSDAAELFNSNERAA
jgi:hypothetical protein